MLNFEAEANSLRPRPKGPEAKVEARGYETEAEAKTFAPRPVWPGGFNISATVQMLSSHRVYTVVYNDWL